MCHYEPTRLPDGPQQFESHHWIFSRKSGDISSRFGGIKTGCFFQRKSDVSILERGDQNRYFMPNHDFSLTINLNKT